MSPLPPIEEAIEAIEAIRRDPTRPGRVKVDEGLTVEVRAGEAAPAPKRSAAEVLREIGRWEGESGDDLDALFVRQRSSRQVPDLAVMAGRPIS